MFFDMTYQVRVLDHEEGIRWYTTFFNREADFTPHEGFAEWEMLPGCWLQVAEGQPTQGSGPMRLAVVDLEDEVRRMQETLEIGNMEAFSRDEVPVKWTTFSDPWGNRIGLFEYRNKLEEQQRINELRPNKQN